MHIEQIFPSPQFTHARAHPDLSSPSLQTKTYEVTNRGNEMNKKEDNEDWGRGNYKNIDQSQLVLQGENK